MRQHLEKAGKAPAFSAGNETSEPIRQLHTLSELLVRVSGTITITGGTGAGSWHADAAYRILRLLKVDYDGETRVNLNGPDCLLLDTLFEPQVRVITFPSSLAAAAYSFDVVYRIPFHMLGARQEQKHGFALPTRLVDAPMLKITGGNAGDLTYGSTDYTTIVFTTANVEVFERVMDGIPTPVRGTYSPLLIGQSTVRYVASLSEEVHELPGMAAGRELRALIATAHQYGSGDVDYRRVDSVLTKLGLHVPGSDNLPPVDTTVIQRLNALVYNRSSVITGAYVLDPAENRNVGPHELWTVTRGQRPNVKFDATYNGSNGDHLLRFMTLSTAGRVAG